MTEKPSMKLLRAIGQIDDKYVEEASTPYKKSTLFEIFSSKSVRAIAASFVCAVIVIFAVVLLQPKFDNIFDAEIDGSSNKNDYPNADMAPYPTLEADGAKLTVVDIKSTTYRFILEITKEQGSLDFTIKGKDRDGNPIIFTTSGEVPDNYTRVTAARIIVNGKTAEKLPCEPGTYNVTIDVSPLLDAGYSLENYFVISPFGIIN